MGCNPIRSAGDWVLRAQTRLSQKTHFDPEVLARLRRNQSNGVETQSAQRLESRSQRNASASVASFELHGLCDEIGLRNFGVRRRPRRFASCSFFVLVRHYPSRRKIQIWGPGEGRTRQSSNYGVY
jgi:hypothetical protein